MRTWCLLLVVVLAAGCKPGRKVNTSFYYWKTVYRQNNTEDAYLTHLHVKKIYIRIMDVDFADDGVQAVPVSPIVFNQKVPDKLQVIPVVFVVNQILKNASHAMLDNLAKKIVFFVDGKMMQAGKKSYSELQIDCDWTAETRDNYFYLLQQLKLLTKHKILSATLRLHQIKNQNKTGIPPVDKAMLMCYNMGNLRKYGQQNSIIEVNELKKYLGDNLTAYPMPMDIGLPIFSWAVAFRNKQYIGIDKKINFSILNDQTQFVSNGNNMYSAQTDLPNYGLQKGDEVRWENPSVWDLKSVTAYLSSYINSNSVNVIYFHLDGATVKNYDYKELENIGHLLH